MSSFESGPVAPDRTFYSPAPDPRDGAVEFDGATLSHILAAAADRIRSARESPHEVDGWLAPRLHATIRLRRRQASDPGFWAWTGVEFGVDYIRARWARGGERSNLAWRFTSEDLLRHGLSRLWWGAELARNGPDYSAVPLVFKRANVAQFALELRYSWLRQAVIAFVHTCEDANGHRLRDDQVRELSVRLNAYFATVVLESIPETDDPDPPEDDDWYRTVPSLKSIELGHLAGPPDGSVPEESVRRLRAWMANVVHEIRETRPPAHQPP